MAYGSNNGQSVFERASKLGHLPIIQNDYVNELVKEFASYESTAAKIEFDSNVVSDINETCSDIKTVISIDGSFSTVENKFDKNKSVSYIKVATLMISLDKLDKARAPIVNPVLLNDIISEYSDTIATVLPLNNVKLKDETPLDSIRKIIEITLKEQYSELYNTLKFLVFKQWDPTKFESLEFGCPFCERKITVMKEFDEVKCNSCLKKVFLTDYISLHTDFYDGNTNEKIASSFMQVLEHLLLFNYIRLLYLEEKNKLSRVLFLKDGPLALFSQLSRLVEPIREFIQHLKDNGIPLYLAGIEKSGSFFEHALILDKKIKGKKLIVPNNKYIFSYIKQGDYSTTNYGERVNYGSKVFIKLTDKWVLSLSVPTGEYKCNPKKDDLIGVDEIASILPKIVSNSFPNALLPIVAVNKIASMSIYPTNNILEKFTFSLMDN